MTTHLKMRLFQVHVVLIMSMSSLRAQQGSSEFYSENDVIQDGPIVTQREYLTQDQESTLAVDFEQNYKSAHKVLAQESFRRAITRRKLNNTNAVRNMNAGGGNEMAAAAGSADKNPNFMLWNTWQSKYPSCNPTLNKNLSPININTAEVVQDRTTPTLFVYSNSPIDDYTVSGDFHSAPDYNMTALNIKLSSTRHHEATYVTGLGDMSYRFFEYALFLFTKNNYYSQLSLHRINNKSFPLEIVMFFSTTRSVDDSTQIHVLVNISKVENPLFKPVVDAAKKLADRQQNFEANKERAMNQHRTVHEMKAMLDAEREERVQQKFYTKIENFKDYIELVQSSEDAIQQNTGMMMKSQVNIDECEAGIAREKENTAAATALIEELLEKIQDLEAGIELNKNNTDLLRQLKADLVVAENKRDSSNGKIAILNNRIESERDRIKKYKEQVNSNQREIAELFEGIGQGNITNSLEATDLYHESLRVVVEEREARAELSREFKTYQKYLEELSPSVRLPLFQVSWLLPAIGGHYIYDGSLPVPPCTQRGFTIVMESVVSISQEQFDAIIGVGDIPGLESMRESLPILAEVGNRKIRYNKKNLQYILDDAVHMKSKLRKKLKDQKRNQCQKIAGECQFVLMTISVMFLVLLV